MQIIVPMSHHKPAKWLLKGHLSLRFAVKIQKQWRHHPCNTTSAFCLIAMRQSKMRVINLYVNVRRLWNIPSNTSLGRSSHCPVEKPIQIIADAQLHPWLVGTPTVVTYATDNMQFRELACQPRNKSRQLLRPEIKRTVNGVLIGLDQFVVDGAG